MPVTKQKSVKKNLIMTATFSPTSKAGTGTAGCTSRYVLPSARTEFKEHWYFFYHNGGVQEGGSPCTRSVCVDYLFYNPDDTIKRIIMTSEGVAAAE